MGSDLVRGQAILMECIRCVAYPRELEGKKLGHSLYSKELWWVWISKNHLVSSSSATHNTTLKTSVFCSVLPNLFYRYPFSPITWGQKTSKKLTIFNFIIRARGYIDCVLSLKLIVSIFHRSNIKCPPRMFYPPLEIYGDIGVILFSDIGFDPISPWIRSTQTPKSSIRDGIDEIWYGIIH